jgi:WD40 repeat protein
MPRAQLEGHADMIITSSAGDYIIAAGGNGTVTVLDLHTDLIASYKGHGFRLTSLTSPTTEHPFLISADVRGAVRAWPVPARFARVVATSSSPFHTAIFDHQSTVVMATTWLPALTTFSPSTGVRALEPHEAHNVFLEQSNNGNFFATYGLTDLVEVWSSASMTRTNLIHTEQGSISQLRFIDDSDDFITAGHDGRLVRWTPSGKKTKLTEREQPIDKFAQVPAIGAIVFSTADGALWRMDAGGQVLSLRSGGPRVNRILITPDQQFVYAGYANGDVVAVDTKFWQQEIMLHGSGAVREIAITNDGRTIAVATNDGTIHVGTQRAGMSNPGESDWVTWTGRARHITLAPDGLLVASCTDGTIWLYSPPLRRWLCLPTGTVDLGRTAVTDNGKAAVALDREGRLIWIDLEAVRRLLDTTNQHAHRE